MTIILPFDMHQPELWLRKKSSNY